MTAQTHDPAATTDSRRPSPRSPGVTSVTANRPRWLLPGLLMVFIAATLVVAGVLSLSTAIYAGLFGGMVLMHVGGHGGHGAHQGGHAAQRESTPDPETLSADSSGPQAPRSDSERELVDRASTNRHGNETEDHDQHSPHGCH